LVAPQGQNQRSLSGDIRTMILPPVCCLLTQPDDRFLGGFAFAKWRQHAPRPPRTRVRARLWLLINKTDLGATIQQFSCRAQAHNSPANDGESLLHYQSL
jgi:hypothetical protein